MKTKIAVTLIWILFTGAGVYAGVQQKEANVNSKYDVESVQLSGVSESKISKTLRDDLQKLVGVKYNQEAASELATRLRRELRDYSVELKVRRGKPDHVKVVFEAERIWWKRFEMGLPLIVYHSKQGLSGSIEIPISFYRHNVFMFGLVSSADELLERNAGYLLRYENRKVGTDHINLRIDFNSYHQTFNAATHAALAFRPDVPGVYRERQEFAPSLSFIPYRDLKLSVGTSFQRLQIQYPTTNTQTAYAGTANIQYRHQNTSGNLRHGFGADYSLRTATRILDSDFVYTRHLAKADYTLSNRRNQFIAHFEGGLITGTAPLFERFTLGNSFALRGWNKFDVAPLGGARIAYGSLEYRYRNFQVFYDAGTVWDKRQPARVKHGLGFGWASKDGFFMSLAFPVRLHDVVPVFMMGIRN